MYVRPQVLYQISFNNCRDYSLVEITWVESQPPHNFPQVKQGDIIEVDSVRDKRRTVTQDSGSGSPSGSEQGSEGDHVTVRRGRVVVKEIGEQTRKGGYHLTIIRYKHFALIQRRLHCTIIHHNCCVYQVQNVIHIVTSRSILECPFLQCIVL